MRPAPSTKEPSSPVPAFALTGRAPDADSTQVAESIAVILPGGEAANSGAATPPPQVNNVSKQIEGEARRWHVGGKIGTGLSPELFMFGPQAQFGPFFSPHLLFRPNVEFGFGELTDMYAINAEGSTASTRHFTVNGVRTSPWVDHLNFISQSASSGSVSFSNFNYKTGFNIFRGRTKKQNVCRDEDSPVVRASSSLSPVRRLQLLSFLSVLSLVTGKSRSIRVQRISRNARITRKLSVRVWTGIHLFQA